MSADREERMERLRRRVEKWLDSATSQGEIDAMIEASFLMAAADGKLSPVEFDQFASTLEYIDPARAHGDGVQQLVDTLVASLSADGWESRIAQVAERIPDPKVRRNTYRLVAGTSFIDEQIQADEERLLGMLASAFGIEPDEAAHILQDVRDDLFED